MFLIRKYINTHKHDRVNKRYLGFTKEQSQANYETIKNMDTHLITNIPRGFQTRRFFSKFNWMRKCELFHMNSDRNANRPTTKKFSHLQQHDSLTDCTNAYTQNIKKISSHFTTSSHKIWKHFPKRVFMNMDLEQKNQSNNVTGTWSETKRNRMKLTAKV